MEDGTYVGLLVQSGRQACSPLSLQRQRVWKLLEAHYFQGFLEHNAASTASRLRKWRCRTPVLADESVASAAG